MHIPDGYLSPQTCAVGYAIAVPAIAWATHKVRVELQSREVPTLAMFSAASFLIMMLNLPVPGGTTAHAVGATIIAIILGPWAAVVAISVALLFQALVFGDGGVLTWGVNVVNMGIVLPLVGCGLYRLLAGSSPDRSRRRALAAAAAGYVGILVATLLVGIELGIQPTLFHAADGTPLYSPYSLRTAVSAMVVAHLVTAGPAEALLTGAVLSALARTRPDLLQRGHRGAPAHTVPRHLPVIVTGVLIALTPLGLLAPGEAFGEDAPGDLDLRSLGLRAVPEGMHRYASFWNHALLGGYGTGAPHPVLGYLLSGVVGACAIGGATWLLMRASRLVRAPKGAPSRGIAAPSPAPSAERRTSSQVLVPTAGSTTALPAWLVAPAAPVADARVATTAAPSPRVPSRRGRTVRRALAQTATSAVAVVNDAMRSGTVPADRGHRIDDRTTLALMVLCLLAVGVARTPEALVLGYAVICALGWYRGVGASRALRRVWLGVPLLTAVILLPATLARVTPGRTALTVLGVALSTTGLRAAALTVGRTACSVALVLIVTASIPWPRLLRALGSLRLPRVFTAVATMTHRYVVVLTTVVLNAVDARRSRTLDWSTVEGRTIAGHLGGAVLGHSLQLSDGVHDAMRSRGYTGRLTVPARARLSTADAVACLVVLAAIASCGAVDVLAGGWAA